MPLAPLSPADMSAHRRISPAGSLADLTLSVNASNNHGSRDQSRRASRTSQTSPNELHFPKSARPASTKSSRRPSFTSRRKSSNRLSIGSNMSIEQANNGMGNLADELEDALDDDYDGHGSGFLGDLREGRISSSSLVTSPTTMHGIPDPGSIVQGSCTEIEQPQPQALATETQRNAKLEKRKSRHQRVESRYDGSDYGPDSDQDLDDEGFTPIMRKRMRELESVTRDSINTEDTVSEGGGVIQRTMNALRDLGPQAAVENNLSRIIAAYTSMAIHRTHKLRDLFNQAHPLLYGNVMEIPADNIELILTEVDRLSNTTPSEQQQSPLVSLQVLASLTMDLAQTLRGLTDGLTETRVRANEASRRLKSVKDMVEDIRTEQELVETSIMLIQAGDWDRRCRERAAAATCREVVEDFGHRWGLQVEDRPWTRKSRVEIS